MQQLKAIVYTITGKNLKIILLNEKRQTQKSSHWMILFIWNFRTLICTDGSQIDHWLPRVVGGAHGLQREHERSLWGAWSVLLLDCGHVQSISVSQTLLNHTNKLDVLIIYVIPQYLFKVYPTMNNHSTWLYNSQNLSWVEQLKKKSE